MLDVLDTVLPVFVIVGAGYASVRLGLFDDSDIGSILRFTTNFAIPCLLFAAIYRLDLGANFDPAFLVSYYSGAIGVFALAGIVAYKVFGRRPGESVAIAFGALFSNSVLLGLPITERAYGAEALGPTYAIIAIHAPLCYFIGITAMEIARADGRSAADTAQATIRAMFRNALTIGLGLGLAANLAGLEIAGPLMQGVDLVARAGLPAALFGLGGALTRYAIRSGLKESFTVAGFSLLVHPLWAYLLTAHVFQLDPPFIRAAVITASMPPGINAYLFAAMYDRAVDMAASTVLLTTGLAVLTASGWLLMLAELHP